MGKTHVFLEGLFSETALGRFWVQYVVMMSDGFLVRNCNTFLQKKKEKMEKTQKVPGRIYVP